MLVWELTIFDGKKLVVYLFEDEGEAWAANDSIHQTDYVLSYVRSVPLIKKGQEWPGKGKY
jgi:hypothetical protein